ncbi:hypothetical protein RB2654_21978 [Rhodobacterales bacterium HTCC2654]|uniref:Uncharacterized protein n=1 Tax=Maritimibacter alkaliphilus HTCC2654 TaxID=314271 RepID=A3VLJ4_9RHOB|nr:hypothetical protein RB2654_21978 [Rhodobacterales bacterium HTCC2654] [Maritimibacter alkaliphilus HTCC2654]
MAKKIDDKIGNRRRKMYLLAIHTIELQAAMFSNGLSQRMRRFSRTRNFVMCRQSLGQICHVGRLWHGSLHQASLKII